MVSVGYIAACGLGYFYRGRGVFAGRPICALVWAFPVLVLAPQAYALPAWLAVAGLTWLCLTPGHGDYFDMGRSPFKDDELTKPLLRWLPAGYWYDVAGMALTGMIAALPVVAAVSFVVEAWLLMPCALVGAAIAKPLAYEIGWRVYEREGGEWGESANPIAIGEALFGTFAAAIAVASYIGVTSWV